MPDGKLHVLHTASTPVTTAVSTATTVATTSASQQAVVVKTPINSKVATNKQVMIVTMAKYSCFYFVFVCFLLTLYMDQYTGILIYLFIFFSLFI